MDNDKRHLVTEIMTRYMGGQISRRHALRLVGALGVGGLAIPTLARTAAQAQDEGTPMAMATPALGPQADGTNLWKVQVGGMDMEAGIDMHGFFPKDVTVNVGDSIFWQFAPMGMPGFHTVTFLSGAEVPPLFVPDMVDGTPVASPEGPPRLLLNPAFAFPDGRTDYDGTGTANSGLDVLRTPEEPPYMLRFTAAGTYEYQCAVHGLVMKGSVTVQEAGSDLPTDVAGYEEMGQQEIAAILSEGLAARDAAKAATPVAADGTWDISAGAGGLSQARVMRFIPAEVTIKVGDTVRWTDRTVGEPHTVTFLGGTEPPEDTLVEPQQDGPPKLIQSYQTFLPAGEQTFDGTGYHNSGFLGLPPDIGGMFGLNGDSYELTFTTAGEYPYYCILHSSGPDDEYGMTGKVIVQA